MAEKPKARVEIKDFPGLATSIDPDDMPPGSATIQTNIGTDAFGSLSVRQGYKEVSFQDE